MDCIAHIKTQGESSFEIQILDEHLKNTSILAADFAAKFNNASWGAIIGLWHDIDKCN